MRRRFRVLIVLASTILLVLVLNVGTAFAHPNGSSADDYDFPGAVNNNSDVLGPVVVRILYRKTHFSPTICALRMLLPTKLSRLFGEPGAADDRLYRIRLNKPGAGS